MIPKKLPKTNVVPDKQTLQNTWKTNVDVLNERRNVDTLNVNVLYIEHFNYIPNIIEVHQIDIEKANAWFLNQFEEAVQNCYFVKEDSLSSTELKYQNIFYFMKEDLLINFDFSHNNVTFIFRKTEVAEVESLVASIQKFKKERREEKPSISVIISGMRGLRTQSLEISQQPVNIHDNYNDDFIPVHETILRRLKRENDKGITLLHGKPGTGKTSYIRHLILSVEKEVIFLPHNMAASITNPELMDLLFDHPNSILVIEDAENIVIDRNRSGHSPVSAILNLSDGLLSDCLNIQIICSFNTDLSKIDNALLRKGRLIAKYEFQELAAEKAKKLSEKLGFTHEITAPMTLASIYNQDEQHFKEVQKNTIGFRSQLVVSKK